MSMKPPPKQLVLTTKKLIKIIFTSKAVIGKERKLKVSKVDGHLVEYQMVIQDNTANILLPTRKQSTNKNL